MNIKNEIYRSVFYILFFTGCIDLSLREGYVLRMLQEGMLERTYETKRK
jgi:hypothetical protein